MRRKLTLPLGAVADAALERPDISEKDFRVAREGRDLIRSILELDGGPALDTASLVAITDEAFTAARDILSANQDGANAALRVAAEQIDPDTFTSIVGRLLDLSVEPDASIAGEFI